MESYDIVIIGAGPAGCMCAFSAKKSASSLRILLVDKTFFPRTKSCGGVLQKEAHHFLTDTLKLAIPKNVYSSPRDLDVCYLDLDTNFEVVQQRALINIDRKRFDSWLLSLVDESVHIVEGTKLRSFEVSEEGVHLTLRQGEKGIRLKTRFLVDASGGKSVIRKCFGRDHTIYRVTIQEWIKPNQIINNFYAIWDSQTTDTMCWMIPKNGLVIIGAALIPKAEPNKKFSSFKEKLFGKLSLSGIVVKKEGDLIYGPTSRKGICLGDEKVLIAGEAAGLVSPLAGDGITSALTSGYSLGCALGKPNVKKEYERLVGETINRLTKDVSLYNLLGNKETRLSLFAALAFQNLILKR